MNSECPVFVVDDELQVLDSVKCLLTAARYKVLCFPDAKSFLDQIQPEQTGCLITDLSMPEIDGFELQERLNAMKSMLSVIVVTGRADVGGTVRLMRNGALTLLEKPYSAEKLLEAVADSLAVSEQRAAMHRQQTEARRLLSLLDQEEHEVMELAAEGIPNKAISHRLTMSARTIDRRRQSAFTKLGIQSPAGYTRLVGLANDDNFGARGAAPIPPGNVMQPHLGRQPRDESSQINSPANFPKSV